MALIKCTECGHEVSDKASACPNCGCPIESLGAAQEDVMYEEPKKKKGWIWALIVALLCLIGGGGYYAYSKFDDVGSDKDAIVELTPEFIKAIEKYDQLGLFSEGLAAAYKGEKWGYINTKGEEVIPTTIEAQCVGRFSEGLAFVLTYDGFNVIDKEGKIVFKGKSYFDAMHYECEDMPYFINGKLYVPIRDDKGYDFKYAVYDKQGNKIQTTSLAEGEKVYQENRNGKYSIFSEEHRVTEQGNYSTVGLKDSIGKEVLSADYMLINGVASGTTNFSNGVVLVVLSEEIDEEEEYEDKGGIVSEGTRFYYGYADMKGNDTFSAELKERCHESKKTSLRKAEDNERLRKEGPDWLQGAWRLELTDDYGNHLGYMYEVFNHGSSKSYIDDRLLLEHDYTVSDDMIMYDKGHYQLDNTRQIVLGANGKEMQKISDDPYYTPNSSSSQSSSSSYSNNSSSSSKGYRFSSPQDVIGWLADKSFYNGNRRLRIRPNGVWLNDYCATGAPNVERWESWKALIRAYTATGERLSFFVNPINGTVTDEASDVFRLR